MTTTYEDLLDTVRQHGAFHPLTASEATDEYLKRLLKAVSGVTKRMFDDMPEEAQQWFDNAATAMSERMPLPLPEGFTRNGKPPSPAPAPAADADNVVDNVVELKPPVSPIRRPRPTGSAVPARTPPPPPPPKPPQTAQADSFGDEPIAIKIHRMLIADQAIPIDSLIKRLKEQGVQARDATVKAARYNTLAILRLIREAGWQPPP